MERKLIREAKRLTVIFDKEIKQAKTDQDRLRIQREYMDKQTAIAHDIESMRPKPYYLYPF